MRYKVTGGAFSLVVPLLALLGGPPAAAAQDLVGGRSMAMGGTLRAAPSADAALLLNPAGMSLGRFYAVNALYQFRASDSASLVNVSIVDSVTSRVAAGLFYSYGHASPACTLALGGGKTFALTETVNVHEAGIALSYPLANMLHLGVTTKYVRRSVDQPEGTPAETQEPSVSNVTLDVGAILKPISALSLAAVGYNLIPVEGSAYPREVGFGVSYALGTVFLAEFDAVLNLTGADSVKASYHGGGELFLGNTYAIRGGAMHDTLRQATYATGGLGLVSSKMGLDIGLRQMVNGGAETLVAFAIRLYVN
jgi:hypothetical protein